MVTIPENGTTDDIDLMLYMLQNQRINAVAMNQAHFKDAIRTSSLEAKQFSEVYKFGQVFLYLVFLAHDLINLKICTLDLVTQVLLVGI